MNRENSLRAPTSTAEVWIYLSYFLRYSRSKYAIATVSFHFIDRMCGYGYGSRTFGRTRRPSAVKGTPSRRAAATRRRLVHRKQRFCCHSPYPRNEELEHSWVSSSNEATVCEMLRHEMLRLFETKRFEFANVCTR